MVPLDCGFFSPGKSYGHLRAGQRSLTWAMTSLTKKRGYREKDKRIPRKASWK
jgi:hypothetical protein